MLTFCAKWNVHERVLTLDASSTLDDLQHTVLEAFELQTCKITGLKRKTATKSTSDEGSKKLLDNFVIRAHHKLLALGCKSDAAAVELEQIRRNQEIMEEEVDYDVILKAQEAKVVRKLGRANALQFRFIKRLASNEELQNMAIVLCHDGDVDTLQRIWQSDLFAPKANLLCKFAVRNDRWNIVHFFLEKQLLSADNRCALTTIAAKYGRLHIVVELIATLHGRLLPIAALEKAIAHGHLRVARTLQSTYSSCFDKKDLPRSECLNKACEYGYERMLRWFCNTFPVGISFNHNPVRRLMEGKAPNAVQCAEIILYHPRAAWTQDNLNHFLAIAMKFRRIAIVELLLDNCDNSRASANVDRFDANGDRLLLVAVNSLSFECVQCVVQHMQQKRHSSVNDWYQGVMDDAQFCKEILSRVVKLRLPDILMYLLNVVVLSAEFFACLLRVLTASDVTFVQEVLKNRVLPEETAQLAATVLALQFKLLFPVDVNRIIMDYFIGADGRRAAKYREETSLFDQCCSEAHF